VLYCAHLLSIERPKDTTLLNLQGRLVPTKICDIPTTLYWVTTTPMHPARKYCVKCLLLEEEHIGNYFTTTLLSRSKWEKKKRLKIYGVPNCSCWLLKKKIVHTSSLASAVVLTSKAVVKATIAITLLPLFTT
jgi:hypothetical protein